MASPLTNLAKQQQPSRAEAFDGLRRAKASLERAERDLVALEALAARVARPLDLAQAHAVWKRLEVAGYTGAPKGPGLVERLRAARAKVASAEEGLRTAEAEIFSRGTGLA
jgi:hypothetical protein